MIDALKDRIEKAQKRYGNFASTHEAMGVAMEEWDEFREAVRCNNMKLVQNECLDLAAVLIRLNGQLITDEKLQQRSTK